MQAASSNTKTTIAKRNTEAALRERREQKQAKKDARKRARSDHLDSLDRALNTATTEAAQPGAGQAALEPVVQVAEID